MSVDFQRMSLAQTGVAVMEKEGDEVEGSEAGKMAEYVMNVDFERMHGLEAGVAVMEKEGDEVQGSGAQNTEVSWAEMLPEALVDVMKRLSMKERLESASQVCRSWRKASLEPSLWQVVDLREWCMSVGAGRGGVIDRTLRLAVERSCGGLQELHVSQLESDACLKYLAQSGLQSLRTLSITDSEITDVGLCELVLAMPTFIHLDLSKCYDISEQSLKIIGQNCKSLTKLVRNMHKDRGDLTIFVRNTYKDKEDLIPWARYICTGDHCGDQADLRRIALGATASEALAMQKIKVDDCLTKSVRTMYMDYKPWDNHRHIDADDNEALAIAQYMPKLKHLEFVVNTLSKASLVEVVDNCPDLVYLDVRNEPKIKIELDYDALLYDNRLIWKARRNKNPAIYLKIFFNRVEDSM